MTNAVVRFILTTALVLCALASRAQAQDATPETRLVPRDDTQRIEQQVQRERAGRATTQSHGNTTTAVQIPLRTNANAVAYLPLVFGRIGSIGGIVTLNGAPAALEIIVLRENVAGVLTSVMTATTDATGRYQFHNPPTTAGAYYVRYYNTSTSYNNRLALYLTRDLTFTLGSQVTLDSFDIVDIPLASPNTDATVVLPQSFQWTRRAQFLAGIDSYVFEMSADGNGTRVFRSDQLGYADGYVLSRPPLPSDFQTDTPYSWGVKVRNPGDGFTQPLGLSYYVRPVKFAN